METRRNAGRAPARAGLRAVSVVKVEDKKEDEMGTGKEKGGGSGRVASAAACLALCIYWSDVSNPLDPDPSTRPS